MAIDRRTLLGAGLGGTAALVGCPDLARAQVRRRTLNAMISIEPATLNYPLLNLRQTQQVCSNINEALLHFDWQLRPHPNLARGLEISPDGLQYIFHLEPAVLWHDKVPFTAKDVVFSSDVMLRQLNARSRASLSHCESIKALDDHTVEYKLKQPYNAFLLSFMGSSGPMMPAHIYEGTDFRTNPYNNRPIGTGPFKFQQWQRDNSFIWCGTNTIGGAAGRFSMKSIFASYRQRSNAWWRWKPAPPILPLVRTSTLSWFPVCSPIRACVASPTPMMVTERSRSWK
jgi:ABC-type transport system substrate-binding protein